MGVRVGLHRRDMVLEGVRRDDAERDRSGRHGHHLLQRCAVAVVPKAAELKFLQRGAAAVVPSAAELKAMPGASQGRLKMKATCRTLTPST